MRRDLQKKEDYQPGNLIGIDEIQCDLQKKYLEDLDLNILPIGKVSNEVLLTSLSKEELMAKVRFFELTKFVYEKDIKISYKLKSVYSALHSTNSSFIFKIVSNGRECKIYLGVKSGERVNQKAEVLKGALIGNFPGTTFSQEGKALKNDVVLNLNNSIFEKCNEVTAVVGTPSLKDSQEEQFIQGIENLILGMSGKSFSALFISEPIIEKEVDFTLDAYEQIYSILSGDKEFVLTEGMSSSKAITRGTSDSMSITDSFTKSTSEGTNSSTTTNSSPWLGRKLLNSLFGTNSNNAKSISGFLEKKVNIASFGTADLKTRTDGNKSVGSNSSSTESSTNSSTNSKSTSYSESDTHGINSSKQKTFTNKKVFNFLDRLDKQINRLEQGKGVGFWKVGAFFMSNEEQNSVIAANIYNGIIKGTESNFESTAVRTYNSINSTEKEKVVEYLKQYEIPRIENFGFLGQAITTDELTVQINFPHKSIIGLDVIEITPFGNNPQIFNTDSIKVGKLYNYEKKFDTPISLDYKKFSGHIFVTGSTGSGKSNVTYNLIDKLYEKNIKFLVIEPAKGEYKDVFGNRKDVRVYGLNSNFYDLLKINPFSFPKEIHIYEHIDRFIEILCACWPMEAAMPAVLKEAIEETYSLNGWLLDESRNINGDNIFPTFLDLLQTLPKIIAKSSFSSEVKGNYEGALVSRVKSLTNGINRLVFSQDCIEDSQLFDNNVIVDLSRVASSESKALFMGILFMKLNEYRISTAVENNTNLKHITILEEAHNLLKRTSSDQSMGASNLAGKSVEMISNAIAEMRTYGEGFIIADQSPGLLDMAAIRNTNTKICLRLPEFSDRDLVGKSMNLNEEQINQLSKLETGVAAIYQNEWQEAILCKFDMFENKEKSFSYIKNDDQTQKIKAILREIDDYESSEIKKDKQINNLIDNIKLNLKWDFLISHSESFDFNLSPQLLKKKYLHLIKNTFRSDVEDSKKILKFYLQLVKTIYESESYFRNKVIKIDKIIRLLINK